MSYKCEVREQAFQLAMSIRTRTRVQDLPQVLGKGYGAIAQYLGELQEEPAGPPFAIYYNEDMQNLDIEFGFPVGRRLAGKNDAIVWPATSQDLPDKEPCFLIG